MINLDDDNHRYLSLTGVAMKTSHARDYLGPSCDWIKTKVFDHDPDDPLIFHRSDICQKKKKFGQLKNPEKADLFDRAILRIFEKCDYTVITALVDKKALAAKDQWRNDRPYHFLMDILVEKYVQFLKRKKSRGDIMPEGRQGKKDTALQKAFLEVCQNGTHYVGRDAIAERLTTTETLKFRYKANNIAGQQLCDLIAHPSHMYIRTLQNHKVTLGPFAQKVTDILVASKYDRSSTGVISGYGTKYFP
tara:strand:- start:767 stop:1510 length:744 start_codon:yes stop_codon:yes gene_type:complete